MISYYIGKAIKKINPLAEYTVHGNNTENIEWLNGTTPISISDIEAQIPTVEAEIEQEIQNAETKKASGKQKLKDLGLTDDEIEAFRS